jgi:hypothetical protein
VALLNRFGSAVFLPADSVSGIADFGGVRITADPKTVPPWHPTRNDAEPIAVESKFFVDWHIRSV